MDTHCRLTRVHANAVRDCCYTNSFASPSKVILSKHVLVAPQVDTSRRLRHVHANAVLNCRTSHPTGRATKTTGTSLWETVGSSGISFPSLHHLSSILISPQVDTSRRLRHVHANAVLNCRTSHPTGRTIVTVGTSLWTKWALGASLIDMAVEAFKEQVDTSRRLTRVHANAVVNCCTSHPTGRA